MKNNPGYQYIPAVIFSILGDESNITKNYELGASSYVIKSFDAYDDLRTLIGY